jgi:hypothetical protein
MRRPDAQWTAYHRGLSARKHGVAFKHNPYKSPKGHTSWALGWLDYPTLPKLNKEKVK